MHILICYYDLWHFPLQWQSYTCFVTFALSWAQRLNFASTFNQNLTGFSNFWKYCAYWYPGSSSLFQPNPSGDTTSVDCKQVVHTLAWYSALLVCCRRAHYLNIQFKTRQMLKHVGVEPELCNWYLTFQSWNKYWIMKWELKMTVTKLKLQLVMNG